jgi:hypothetical protein
LVTAQHLTVKTTFQWAPDPKKDVPDPNGVITRMLDATSIIRGNWFAMDPNIVSNDYIRNFSTLPLVSTLQLSLGPGMYVATGPKATDTSEKGLVLRTPAVGTLRLCGGASCATNDATNWTDATQTIAELDEIGVAQYGKRIIMPFRNVVLQNTSVTIALAADGTITSLGTHDQSIGNSVLGTVGTDVQGVASAYAARNTAIGAANTATQNAVQWADTVNKALADCLAQQKAIIQAGVTPTTSCQ